jgi:uncharacterized membrane protein YkoI
MQRLAVVGLAVLGATAGRTAHAQGARGSLETCAAGALAKHPGQFVKLELETAAQSVEANRQPPDTPLYELEVRVADNDEWEFTCLETTGKIVEIEREVPSADDSLFKAKAKVSVADAKQTVLAAHPGTITELEYEIEANGAATYEFDVRPATGTDEHKVEVDATTGKIVEWRREHYQIGIEASATVN